MHGGEESAARYGSSAYLHFQSDSLQWQFYQSDLKLVDLNGAIGPNSNVTAYAFCEIFCESGGRFRFYLGSDDGPAVWINGNKVFYQPNGRSLLIDQDNFETDLKAGVNFCLVKITQNDQNWAFSLRALPADSQQEIVPRQYLGQQMVTSGVYLNNNYWKYHPGNSPEWKNKYFDDSSWENTNPALSIGSMPFSGWTGEGWFRAHFEFDPQIKTRTLAVKLCRPDNHSYTSTENTVWFR